MVVSSSDPEILLALLKYAGVVVLGLFLMIVFYCILFSHKTLITSIFNLKQFQIKQLEKICKIIKRKCADFNVVYNYAI